MAKSQTLFVCSSCGEEFIRWQGQCSNCRQWNTLKEFTVAKRGSRTTVPAALQMSLLADVSPKGYERVATKIFEFDRVAGGGIVPGSILLLGGDPGIGKSTLLLQVSQRIGGTFYLSAEESLDQIKLRAKRLGIDGSFTVVSSSDILAVTEHLKTVDVKLLVVDSIQTVYHRDYPSSPGSQVQVRESAMHLQQFAKSTGIPVILVGHVTKEGTVVQALTTATVFGYPKRSANGFDVNRLNLLAAVLEQRAGVTLGDQDIYINVVGGVKLKEPATDLAVAVAIVSARKGHALPQNLVVYGEVGLSGEIRKVSQAAAREIFSATFLKTALAYSLRYSAWRSCYFF
ncbi:AAA family ATPase [Candidatus Berkelbacteria bacterium]|nr:AAA family ATPase [Candidatus Berkelbacteria bacterium]